MSRPKSLKPAHCEHKSSGRGYVYLDGRYVYTGKWGTQAAKDEYDRLIGEWIAGGRRLPSVARDIDGDVKGAITVNVILAAFWTHAQTAYPGAEEGSKGEANNYRDAMRPLRRLYGRTPVAEFGPRALKAVQLEMARVGWCRNVINRQTGRIKAIFKWAVAEELIPAAIYHALLAVTGLKLGNKASRESEPVKPAPEADVKAVLNYVSDQIAGMVRLQLLTGMRPGEVCKMQTGQISTAKKVWIYRPATHKTAHHGHIREVRIGPKAQEVLKPFLKPDLAAFIFSPADAEAAAPGTTGSPQATPYPFTD